MELPQFWGFGRVKVRVHRIICSVYGLIIEEVNGSILQSLMELSLSLKFSYPEFNRLQKSLSLLVFFIMAYVILFLSIRF
jgi:hypothetical protein